MDTQTLTHFRQMRPEHLERLQAHVLELYSEDPSHTPANTMSAEKVAQTFREFTEKPDKGRIIVFEKDHNQVGYAFLVNFWSNEYGGDVVEIDELFVEAAHRGTGIGREFFTWLKKEERCRAVALSLQTTPSNIRAAAFYHDLGFRLAPNRRYVQSF